MHADGDPDGCDTPALSTDRDVVCPTITPPVPSEDCSTHILGPPKVSGLDDTTLEKLLMDDNLLRLWRTGANEEIYNAEEDEAIDVSACSSIVIIYMYLIII